MSAAIALVLERLALHHVAPVAGRVADREEDRLVLRPGLLQRLLAPGIPVHRVVGVLQQVGAGRRRQSVGVFRRGLVAHTRQHIPECAARRSARSDPGPAQNTRATCDIVGRMPFLRRSLLNGRSLAAAAGAGLAMAAAAPGPATRAAAARGRGPRLAERRLRDPGPGAPRAEALAARGDTIVAVGSWAEVEPYVGPRTEVLDLAGRLAVPGFIEGHGHFTEPGRDASSASTSRARGAGTRSWTWWRRPRRARRRRASGSSAAAGTRRSGPRRRRRPWRAFRCTRR